MRGGGEEAPLKRGVATMRSRAGAPVPMQHRNNHTRRAPGPIRLARRAREACVWWVQRVVSSMGVMMGLQLVLSGGGGAADRVQYGNDV